MWGGNSLASQTLLLAKRVWLARLGGEGRGW